MTDLGNHAIARPYGPPLRTGFPLLLFCVLALAYAYLAIPQTLIPGQGLLNVQGGPAGNDFLAFYAAAQLAWSQSPADVFNLSRLFPAQEAISGTAMHLPFPYPPSFLMYVAPLAAMNYLPALYVWLAATTLPFVMIVKKLSGLAAPIIMIAPPLIQNTIDGQNGALTASLFAGGLLLLASQRRILAGLLLGLLSYKPQVFILIPICLLAAREYRALLSLMATGCLLLLGSIAAFGFEIWLKFIAFMPQQLAFILNGNLPVNRCPTLFMFVFHTTGNLALANALQFCSTLAAWALAAWTWRRTTSVFPRALAFCVAMPLSTPYLLEYDLAVWTLPASILLARLWRGEGGSPDWASLTLLWFLPPAIWLMKSSNLNLAALATLPLAAYTIWIVHREPAIARQIAPTS